MQYKEHNPEELRTIADTGYGKTRELVGMTFALLHAELKPHKGVDGQDTDDYVGTILLDGNEDQYWLNGARVRRLVEWLLENDGLPAWFRIIRRGDLSGNPFELEPVSASVPAPVHPPAAPPSQVVSKAAVPSFELRNLWDEACLLLGEDSAACGILSDGGLDEIMDIEDDHVVLKQVMRLGQRVKAIKLLKAAIEEKQKGETK